MNDLYNNTCTVVAFDPGQTTGWAVITVTQESLLGANNVDDKLQNHIINKQRGEISCLGPLNGWDSAGAVMENDGVMTMLSVVYGYPSCAIVFEDFIIDFNQVTKTRSALSPVTVMAKFEIALQHVWASNNTESLNRIFRQNRSPVKTTCTDDRMKTWGLYDRHSGPHARDATRHAYYFLKQCRGNNPKAAEKRWRAWPQYFPDPFAVPRPKLPRVRQPGARIDGLG